MKHLNSTYLPTFLLVSFLFVTIKYFLSFIEFPSEELIIKIIRFTDTEYAYLVESFSRFDFTTDWSNLEKSKKIIGFPIFSIIIHAILFKFLGYYSFLILEIFFFFLIIYFLFLILSKFEDDKIKCFSGILILLILCQLIELGKFYRPEIFAILNPITEFVGLRFPRPLTTSIFAFVLLFNLLILIKKEFLECKKNIYVISICLGLLINSFFHLFFIFFILTSFCIAYKFIKDDSQNPVAKIQIIVASSFILLIGIIIFFTQQYFSENDYANRIGVHYLTLNDRIQNSLEFLKIFSQIEYLGMLFLCIVTKLFIAKKFKNNNVNDYLLVLFVFVLASFFAPIIFLFISNKVIVSHHFLTITKFALFLFIFISFFFLIKKYLIKKIIILIMFFFPIFLINNFYVSGINLDKSKEEKKIYDYLKDNDYTKTDKILFANDFFDHIWFSLGNKYISVPRGFSASLKDHQIENLIFYMFKTFKIDKKNFDEKINNRECIRECFATYFNYKYVVNSIRHYKPLNEEYSKVDVKIIQNISEIDWWYLIIPNSEKTRLKDKFINLEFDQSYSPNLIILTNQEILFFGENLSDNYTKVIDGKFYRVYKKN